MIKSWTLGLDPKRAEEIAADFRQSVVLRERLTELLEKKIKVAHEGSLSKDKYNVANWAYLQADTCGYERAINDVISLISNDSVEKD